MPLLRFYLASVAFLCVFATCGLPCIALAAEPLPVPPSEEQEEYPLPTRLAPMRERQTPPSVLRQSALEAVLKLEAEERLEAEAEAKLEAEQRVREERALALREQQAERERARIALELRQARARTIADAVKMASLPPVAVVPAKKDWPLPKLVEDPAWLSPTTSAFYHTSYTQADIKASYRQLLKEAANGNPRAMIILSYAYKRWGSEISSAFSDLHPPMHSSDYWRRWALQLTSPDWVLLRLGDVSQDIAERISCYRDAAAYHNNEAIYNIAIMDDKPELLLEAAGSGHPGAAAIVAFNLGMGTDGFPASPRLAASYWWRGALAGDVRSMLVCSEFFFHGQNGFPKDERRSYMFALLAVEEAQKRGSTAAAILPSAQRHLAGLGVALGLGPDAIWERQQDLQIFCATAEEERLARLDSAAPVRESVLYALETELAEVRAALGESDSLTQLSGSGAGLRYSGGPMQRENYYFIRFGVLGAAIVLGAYLAMRLRFYSKVVRLVSVKEGGQS